MDRARRAEPYSSATIWTREVARNLAGHLARISNAHSCVDTSSPKSTQLPKFQHPRSSKRCATSPMKTRKAPVDPLTTTSEVAGGAPSCSSSTGRREEGCDDNQNDQRDFESTGQREDSHAQRHEHKVRLHLGPAKMTKSHKHSSDVELLPESDYPMGVTHETRKMLDKIRVADQARLKAANVLGDSTYDCPPAISNGKLRAGMDYKQKQAQLKIWQENQALAKRLRSTKPTLKSKDWERDDKWNQEFLKSQERRRLLLHTELVKAQAAPHTTIVRVRPLKLPHHEHSSVVVKDDELPDRASGFSRCHTSAVDGSGLGSLFARETRRRRSRSQTLGADPLSDAETQHLRSGAANHHRIMQLRQQKRLHSTEDGGADPADSDSPVAAESSGGTAVDLNDDELVDVRFTFPRQRSRRANRAKSEGGDEKNKDGTTEIHGAVEVEQGEAKVSGPSGALSPGVELEVALHRLAREEPPWTQAATQAATHPECRESICPDSTSPALDHMYLAKTNRIDASPHLSSEDSESDASEADRNRQDDIAHPSTDNGEAPADTADCSESKHGDQPDDGGAETPPAQSDMLETTAANGVDSGVDDVTGRPTEISASEKCVLTDPVVADDERGADVVQRQDSTELDQTSSDNTDEQLITSDALEADVVPASGGEIDSTSGCPAPITDEQETCIPSEQQQADGITSSDEPPLNAEPEYRDDTFDDDYQNEEDQLQDGDSLAASVAIATVNEATGGQGAARVDPDDAGDDNEYGSEYEDDAELDQDGNRGENARTEASYLGEAAGDGGDAREQEEEGNGELEYSQDGFADD